MNITHTKSNKSKTSRSVITQWQKRITKLKHTMLTIKEAAALVDGLTEYRVRELCKSGKLPCFKAGKKYLINKEILHKFLSGELLVK